MIGLHLAWRVLVAFDADELRPGRRRRAQRHLAECARCRGRLKRLRAVRSAAAEVTALTPPDVLGRIEARRRAGEILLLPVPEPAGASEASGKGSARGPLLAASVALALLAGSVAAAVAVPPVRAWMAERLAPIGGSGPSEREEPASGLAVPVGAGGMVVDVRDASPDLVVLVSIEDTDLLDVVGVGAAAAGDYRSGEGRLTVTGLRGGELRIVVPAAAGPVTLTSGRDTLLVAGPPGLRLPDGALVPGVRARLGDLLGAARGRLP